MLNSNQKGTKLVNRITGKKPKPPVPLRFAIRYDRIGLPFRHTEEKIVSKDYSVFVDSVDPIPDKDIDNLWTVVEYDGDGLFTDLVTGCKFRLAHAEKKMHDIIDRKLDLIKRTISKTEALDWARDYKQKYKIHNFTFVTHRLFECKLDSFIS